MDRGSTGPFCSSSLPLLDESDHVLVTRIFELPDTIGCTLVTFFSRLQNAESLHIDRVALVGLEDRGELVKDDLCTIVAPLCLGLEVAVHHLCAPIPVPFGDAD